MLVRIFILLICFCCFTFSGFRKAVKKTLLVAEFDMKASQNHLQHLYAYYYIDGVFSSKEKIISVPGKKDGVTGNYIRFDLGQPRIYRNRYVITGIGNVIDIKDRKVLLDQKDQYVKSSGDSIIFYTNDIFKGKYYSVLNLKDGSYSQVGSLLFKAIPGKDVEVDQSARQYKIWLYPPSAAKILLVSDAGYGEDNSARPDKGVSVPLTWIDNSTFVFPHYSQQKNFCTIYKVNADTRVKEAIGEIDNVPAVPYNSYFYRDFQGNLVYVCGKGSFQLDLKKKKLVPLSSEDLGHGFTADLKEQPGSGRILKYQGAEIGKLFCDHRKARATEGMLAVHYDLVINGERYPQSVTVWDKASSKWKEIDAMDVAAVIGWIEN